jgi:hypothetical protein
MQMVRTTEVPLAPHITAHVRWSATNLPAEGSGACTVTVGDPPQTGAGICGTNPQFVGWPNGHVELFVIGLDRAIWHSISTVGRAFSPWSSLGGIANDGVWLLNAVGSNYQIMARGTDDNFYCSTTSSPGTGIWSGWGACNFFGVVVVR